MDWLGLAYYAAVCALVGLVAPWLGRRWVRLIVGGAVGVGAFQLLPMLRDFLP